MNRIQIEYSETTTPKPFHSKKFGIQLEQEITGDPSEEAKILFDKAKAIVEAQKNGVGNGRSGK